ncbi:uncharacterized protein LOC118443476 [Vespa mandarinia]|uniref:uncharacterized protein LOC118443476 n=1 Tax=Vespa mandarinia TaxID=7446 RepID=UPI0016119545|nr:uncharacterized protein LOC118443476 [Vespa mandarinia]XP_035726435.1 uncharacterized protein LOC118443476 [Vespa mandarinia]XP_035726445.1 uncharacterized protein LOC118443476 [Vespa mandarinia]XP_035726454.1 uncharacterized protein LOC118443476 [Vespa mandarinia]XP_035726464.1 uncharacterized protein LOC118443476 [Vespa mandarinia]
MSENKSHVVLEREEFLEERRIGRYLRAIARDKSLYDPSYQVTRAVNSGDNFVSDVYRVTIEGAKNRKMESIHLIVKCAPIDLRRDFIKIRKIFLQEIYFYKEILPIFNNFLRNYNMSIDNIPLMYKYSDTDKEEILILEDLKVKNYIMKETKFLDYPHARLALRSLGKFHAYSFAIRVKDPEAFKILKLINEPLFYRETSRFINQDMYARTKALCDIVEKSLENEDKRYQEKFREFAKNIFNIMIEIVQGSNAEPYAVVNHGDAWTNNFLFKYKENERTYEPEDLCFLDFQICRYASPVLDICYTLFCSTLYEIRNENYDELLRNYYDSFSKCLESLDCNPRELFPYEILLEHIERFGKFAAVMAIHVLHLFTDQDENITTSVDVNVYYKKLKKNNFYRNTLTNTFKEFIDRNII